MGHHTEGRPVLVGLDSGASESTDAWKGFLDGLAARGVRAPLLVVSDGAAGLIGAVELVFPHSLRQKCAIHFVESSITWTWATVGRRSSWLLPNRVPSGSIWSRTAERPKLPLGQLVRRGVGSERSQSWVEVRHGSRSLARSPPYVAGFREELETQGCRPLALCDQLRLTAHVSRWLDGRGLDVGDLTPEPLSTRLRSGPRSRPMPRTRSRRRAQTSADERRRAHGLSRC